MMGIRQKKGGPLVSVMMPTFNRRRFLGGAIRSVLGQTHRNLQIIVANDGGQDVADIVGALSDERIILLQRADNCGKAATLNEALQRAEGKYVCYLDDDDLYYPTHVASLVGALEGQTDCGAAYSDLYNTVYRLRPDGSRQALAKVLNISRDFDRFFLLHYNHVLHMSLMHRRDLLDRTGPYNESIRVLIDWDMTRRLAFFTDFAHVHEVTGEFYSPDGHDASDRISYRMRQDPAKFTRQMLTIRTTRPPKPWPKVPDLSVIFAPARVDGPTVERIGEIWKLTFTPYKLHLALPPGEAGLIDSDVPNVVHVPVGAAWPWEARVDAALAGCEGQYVALLPAEMKVTSLWAEAPLYSMIKSGAPREGVLLKDAGCGLWGALLRTDDLRAARRNHPALSVRRSIEADGIAVRKANVQEFPFLFDHTLKLAQAAETDGNYMEAARAYDTNQAEYDNCLWMKEAAAQALYRQGNQDALAGRLCREINAERPIVSTLLLEAKLHRRNDRLEEAITLLTRAKSILDWPAEGMG